MSRSAAARPSSIRAIGKRFSLLVAVFLSAVSLPAVTPSSAVAQDSSALGTGVYEVTAGPFGTWEDGLIGRPTSSGYLLREGDRLVGLPACTVSSCPWLPLGTGADAASGPQTSCAEGDGLCWVELTNDATGACVTVREIDPVSALQSMTFYLVQRS